MTATKNYILDAAAATKKLQRMAFEIAEQNTEETVLILVGIRDNGVVMANIIAGYLKEIFAGSISILEMTLNKKHPEAIVLSQHPDFDDQVVILVDDVTNSGKTLLYALKPFLDHHPRKIQTLTLIERSHKVYPVTSDYVGISLATTLQEHIFVEVKDGIVTGAYLE